MGGDKFISTSSWDHIHSGHDSDIYELTRGLDNILLVGLDGMPVESLDDILAEDRDCNLVGGVDDIPVGFAGSIPAEDV